MRIHTREYTRRRRSFTKVINGQCTDSCASRNLRSAHYYRLSLQYMFRYATPSFERHDPNLSSHLVRSDSGLQPQCLQQKLAICLWHKSSDRVEHRCASSCMVWGLGYLTCPIQLLDMYVFSQLRLFRLAMACTATCY